MSTQPYMKQEAEVRFNTYNPFEPRSFFEFSQWQKMLDTLNQWMRTGRACMLLTGPEGAGKTTLKNQIKAQLQLGSHIVVDCDGQDLKQAPLAQIKNQLDMVVSGDFFAALDVKDLRGKIEALACDGVEVQVLMDNAHKIDEEGLIELFRLIQSMSTENLRCILFSSASILPALQKEPCRALFNACGDLMEIPAFSLNDTARFAEFFFTQRQLPVPEWSMEQIQHLQKHTHGLPGKLEKLLTHAINQNQTNLQKFQLAFWTGSYFRMLVFSGIVAMALISLFWIVFSSEARQPEMEAAAAGLDAGLETFEYTPEGAAADETSEALIDSVNVPQAQEPVIDVPQTPDPVQVEALVGPEKPGAEHETGEQWVLSRNPDHYTLQLLGASSEEGVQDFISKHVGLSPVAYFPARHRGEPWFIVVYGDYLTFQEAKAALNALDANLKKKNPWIRQYAHIQLKMTEER